MSPPTVVLHRLAGGACFRLDPRRGWLLLPLQGLLRLGEGHAARELRRGELAVLPVGEGGRVRLPPRAHAWVAELQVGDHTDPRWALWLGAGLLNGPGLAAAALRWLRHGDAEDLQARVFSSVDDWLAATPGRSASARPLRLRGLLRARRLLQLAPPAGDLVDRAAAAAALSRWHFSRLFLRVFGAPPATLQRRERLLRALRGVVDGGQPIWRSAQGAGFSRASSFARACRRACDRSPATLRREGSVPAALLRADG